MDLFSQQPYIRPKTFSLEIHNTQHTPILPLSLHNSTYIPKTPLSPSATPKLKHYLSDETHEGDNSYDSTNCATHM